MTLPAGVTDEMVEAAARMIDPLAWSESSVGPRGLEMASPVFLKGLQEKRQQTARHYARKALTAALAGRVVVPREPTPEQRDAIELSLLQEVLQDYAYILPTNGADLLYAAIVAAAVDGGAK